VIYFAWPLAIGLASAIYSICTIRELAIRRAQFREFLAANKNLSASRYFRLMGLASLEVFLTIPLACVSIYLDVSIGVQPYENWANAHFDFSTIVQIPAAVWKADPVIAGSFEMSRYALVFCAFVFFAFFGFADEARRNYRLAYTSVAKRVGLSTGTMSTTGTWTANGTNPDSCATMPVYVAQQMEKKRDSFASFSSRLTLPDVGGTLADVKGPHSPTTSSSASMSKESLPRLPIAMDTVPLPTHPEASLDTSAPPRYTPDVPNAV